MEDQSLLLMQFVPLLIISLALGVQGFLLAKDKGRSVVKWTVLGLTPLVNIFCIWYFVGASNLRQERKLDELVEKINRVTIN
ncbi:MAG: hypothetical protein ACRETN_09395 [Nevskiales bacterium]